MTNAYNFFTAGSLGGTNIVLTFDKPLDAGVAGETSNFIINGGTVLVTNSYQVGRTVYLAVNARLSGNFSVQIYQVPDATAAFLTADDGSGSVTVAGALSACGSTGP